MKLTTSNLLQMMAVLVNVLNGVQPFTSGRVKVYIGVVAGCVTLILHNVAGQSNPDGTPANK